MGILRKSVIRACFGIYNFFAPRIPPRLSLPSDSFTALGEYFDAIWVLTIPRNRDRQEFMKAQLNGLEFEFFMGVDGKSFRDGDPRLDLRRAETLNRRTVRINELACTMSHLVMFQAMVDRGLGRVLILEDDAVLLAASRKWIPYCLERLPSDWELFYLGYRDAELRGFMREFQELLGRHRDPAEVVSRGVGRGLRTAGGHDYTHAYAVTNAGAHKLLQDAYPVFHTADGWLEHNVLSRKVVAYVSVPKVFVQHEELGSSIHGR
jgi:glycosyl transferase family 25